MQKVVTLPNLITITRGLAGGLGIVIAIQYNMFLVGSSIFFLFGMMPDIADGWVARKYNQTSRLGEFLDPFIDKILFYGAMYYVFWDLVWIPSITILFVCDIISTILHFVKKGGAVACGKRKFVLQCISLGLFFLSIVFGKNFIAFANITLIVATFCAVRSIFQRFK